MAGVLTFSKCFLPGAVIIPPAITLQVWVWRMGYMNRVLVVVAAEARRIQSPPKTGVTVSPLTWVLRTELDPSESGTSVLKHPIISPASALSSLFNFLRSGPVQLKTGLELPILSLHLPSAENDMALEVLY